MISAGFPKWLSDKESAYNAGATGDVGSISGSGRSPGGGHGNPLQYSCLENPTDRGACGLRSMWLQKSRTRLTLHTWAQARGLQWLRHTGPWLAGLVAPQHVEPSQTRVRTHVPCNGRRL